MSKHTKELERRIVALEGQVAALLTAMAPVPQAIAGCVALCDQAASVSRDAVVTREVQIVDAAGNVVLRLAATDEGRPVVQLVRRDVSGEIVGVDENLFG